MGDGGQEEGKLGHFLPSAFASCYGYSDGVASALRALEVHRTLPLLSFQFTGGTCSLNVIWPLSCFTTWLGLFLSPSDIISF